MLHSGLQCSDGPSQKEADQDQSRGEQGASEKIPAAGAEQRKDQTGQSGDRHEDGEQQNRFHAATSARLSCGPLRPFETVKIRPLTSTAMVVRSKSAQITFNVRPP